MLIFNTTLHLDDSIHDQCLLYIKDKYIPQAIAGGLLHDPSLSRIESQHEEHGVSYAMQFKVENFDTLDNWASTVGEILKAEMNNRFGTKVAGFVTLMEEIPLHNH